MSRTTELPPKVVEVLHEHGIRDRAIWAPKGGPGPMREIAMLAEEEPSDEPIYGELDRNMGELKPSDLVGIGAFLAMVHVKAELRGQSGAEVVVKMAAKCVRFGLEPKAAAEIAIYAERAVRQSGWRLRRARRAA